MEFFSLDGKWEVEPATCSGSSPHPGLPGLLGGRQRELFPKKSWSGDLAATRREFGDGEAVPPPAPQSWRVTLQSPPFSLTTFAAT